MRNLLIAVVVIIGGYAGYDNLIKQAPQHSDLHDEVIMYSLTTCGYCKKLAAQMDEENIRYTEHFLDEDPQVRKELSMKLSDAGFSGGAIGTPTLDVKGFMLVNNPPLSDVIRYID